MMDPETGFLSCGVGQRLSGGMNPRGVRHWGAASRRQTCMRQVRLDPDHDEVMRIGGEAPGGGPILSVGIGATSATGSRHLGSSTGSPVVDASSERRAGKEMILQRFVSLPDAG